MSNGSDPKSVETRDSEKSTKEDDEDGMVFIFYFFWVLPLNLSLCIGIRVRVSYVGSVVADWDRGEATEASSAPSRDEGEVPSVASEVSEDAALPRRHGRGFFLYQKSCLFSEQKDVPSHFGEDSDPNIDSDEQNQMRTSEFLSKI